MLSVLIPTYNTNVSKLIETVHAQLIESNIIFEIIIFEDGSTQHHNTTNSLSNTRIIANPKNIGRIKARQELANTATYNWLLFLDSDVLPKTDKFITNYIEVLTQNLDVCFGGFSYYKTKPEASYLLRWKYGKTKEEVPANIRNKTPYKVIISANYLIKKDVFNTLHAKISDNKGYGLDNYFGAMLQENKTKVLHIDNEVYHLGIEKSEQYLKKTEQAGLTLLHFYKTENTNNHSNDLLLFFAKLKRYHLVNVFSVFYKLFSNKMKANLLGKSPTITLLQLYKISFMCYAYNNEVNS